MRRDGSPSPHPRRQPSRRAEAGDRERGPPALAVAGLLVVLALLLGALPQTAHAQASNINLFSTTMTVGRLGELVGYFPRNNVGSVGSSTFTYRGGSFSLNWLYALANTVVSFEATADEPSYAPAYRLCLDGDVAFRWDHERFTIVKSIPGSALTAGQEVAVKLVEGRGCDTAAVTAGSIRETSATLTVADHPATWYHKRTAPTTPAAACSPAQTGTTATLTGLTRDTAYTWTTYSDSTRACASGAGRRRCATLPEGADWARR